MITGSKLREFANAHQLGFIKQWKADSIVSELQNNPSMINDNLRIFSYIRNALEMEGFNHYGIERIVSYIKENF